MSERLPPPCPHAEDAAAYLLGAHDDPDAFMRHAQGCEACRAELARLGPVAAALPAAAPPEPMPRELRARLLEQVDAEARVLGAAGPAADRVQRRRRIARPAIAGAVALAAAAAIALALLGGSPASERTTYASVAPAGARAVLRQSSGHAVLQVSGMPQAPRGEVYEVWLLPPHGSPQPTDALFGVTRSGRGAVAIPGALGHVAAVLVTREPDGGSLHPTSAPLLAFHL